jgi:CMP-N-acetylneuraminic acid synthetase
LNGAIYLARRTVLVEQETWYTDQTYAYIMPPERSLDIDTEWDLRVAGLVLKDKVNHAGG